MREPATIRDILAGRRHSNARSQSALPKGPRAQIVGFQGPNTINIIVLGL